MKEGKPAELHLSLFPSNAEEISSVFPSLPSEEGVKDGVAVTEGPVSPEQLVLVGLDLLVEGSSEDALTVEAAGNDDGFFEYTEDVTEEDQLS